MIIQKEIILRCLILLVGLLLCTTTGYADENITARLLTTRDGLPNNTVRDIMQDRKGYIWLSTLDGIARYDGYNFVKFRRDPSQPITLTDQSVRSAFEDKNGFIWIHGANDHVSCLDPRRGAFVDYTGKGMHGDYRYTRELDDCMWLWGEKGALQVRYEDGDFSATAFSKDAGNLPSNTVDNFGIDHQGNVWLTSDNSVFLIKDNKPEKISDSGLFRWMITDGDKATYYITVTGEIYKFTDPAKHRRIATIKGIDNISKLPGELVQNRKWFIFTDKQAYALDLDTDGLQELQGELNIPGAKVITDNLGDFWLHNETGRLIYLNHKSGATKTFSLITSEQASLLDMERFEVARDGCGNAWISTNGNGLFKYDFKPDELRHFHEGDKNSTIIPSNELLCVMVDRSGTIWTGADYTGASRIDVSRNHRPLVLPDFTPLSKQSNSYRLVKRLPDGDILLGTRGGELLRYSSDLSHLKSKDAYSSIIYDAMTDKDGRLWLATRGSGIFVDGVNYVSNSKIPGSLPNSLIFTLCEDNKGRVWIGTMGGGMALAIQQADGTFKFRQFLNDSYGQRRIRSMTTDINGNVWVASNNGLIVFNPDSIITNPHNFRTYNIENKNFKGDIVHCVVRDNNGAMWVGGSGFGLAVSRNATDIDNLEFQYIEPEKGLVNSTVVAISPVKGDILAATEYGLSRLDTNGNLIENYVLSTEPKSNVYSTNTALTLNDSTVLVGSYNGLFALNPFTEQSDPSSLPKVTFTELMINGQAPHTGAECSKLAYTDHIKLAHDQNNIEIDFSSLEYSSTSPATYTYRLVPYDNDWSHPSTLNYAIYKNLPPGDYTLYVRAARKDGKWGEESAMRITISPPWYATWWARLISVLLILAAAVIIFIVMRRIEKLRNRVRLEEQLTDYKLEFFTNISHEFRTPLTLMQVSLEKIHEVLAMPEARETRRNISGHLTTLDKNSRRMSRLINELLTFRKVEKNKLTLNPRPTEVISFLRDIFETFKEEARQKQLNYSITCPLESYTMNVDRDSLDKIAHNLLSNAVKYTLQGGSVEFIITVNEASKRLVIKVKDNGIGIPADKKAQLFSRFMQSNFSHKSIGVGLHLTYGLVQLYGGSIYHEDNVGGGSIFTAEIPTTLPASDVPDNTEETGASISAEMQKHEETLENELTLSPPETGHKLLIIDDDADIREVLTREFSQYFDVITAADGTAGLKEARENEVSLIICDVMMPDMSGFEVTRRLKDDIATSHIPIIQLTALSNDESHMKGIETGADAYITKPFSLQLLKTRAFKLIELRKVLQAKFSSSPTVPRPELPMVSHDRQFYDRLYEIVQQQMENSEFSADDFAAAMNMGRTIFFKKVKGVTGYGPKEFMRIMRMKHAAELLLTTDLTISEIAYKVGMSDPAYFNRCFKTQFGKAPSIYQKENRN